MNIQKIMSSLEAKHPGESEYLQAVKEVLLSIEDIYNQHPIRLHYHILSYYDKDMLLHTNTTCYSDH